MLAVSVAFIGLAVGGALTYVAGTLIGALGVQIGIGGLIVVALVLTQGLGFGGTAVGFLVVRGLTLDFVPVRTPTVGDLAWTLAGYLTALGAAFFALVLVVLTGAPAASNQLGTIAIENPDILLLLIPASFLLIGPGEELLFRGIVQGSLREVFGPAGAIVIASAIFASVHFLGLTGGVGGRLVTILVLFLPALVLGAAYEWTENLVVPALIHGAYNATLFTLVYLSLQYTEAAPA